MSYFDIKAVSNSSLNYIDPESGGNPRLFRKFLDGQLDEKPSKSFEIGTLIHEELLEPGKLDIVPDNTPGPKTQDIIDALWNRLYEDVEAETMQSYSHWILLTRTLGKRSYLMTTTPSMGYRPKSIASSKMAGYWKALFTHRGKKIVDPATWHIVQGCIESIKMHGAAEQLICQKGSVHLMKPWRR